MVLRAHDVAAELRQRLPGVPIKKLHKLLYYCQGHHLAAAGQALFEDSVSAWDMGPVVGSLWHQEREGAAPAARQALDEEQLNTVGYVVSRYGQLSGRDLEHLTHAETPWLRADADRPRGESVRIERDWMREYFDESGGEECEETGLFDRGAISAWLAGADQRRADSLTADSFDALRARLADAG
jgi:uncharacterized phage-associated protein